MSDILVTYFSVTGTTKKAALRLKESLNADIYEIVAKDKYTSSDLNWNNRNSRTTVEGNNPDIRPDIEGTIDISSYNTIYVGFPIWWYRAPNIINSFLEKYDFSNKTIVLFATSGGSAFANTIDYLKTSVSDTCVFKLDKVYR